MGTVQKRSEHMNTSAAQVEDSLSDNQACMHHNHVVSLLKAHSLLRFGQSDHLSSQNS